MARNLNLSGFHRIPDVGALLARQTVKGTDFRAVARDDEYAGFTAGLYRIARRLDGLGASGRPSGADFGAGFGELDALAGKSLSLVGRGRRGRLVRIRAMGRRQPVSDIRSTVVPEPADGGCVVSAEGGFLAEFVFDDPRGGLKPNFFKARF